MSKFSVVYDACVLYPAPLRDLFKAQWTDQIHEEWINALLRKDKFKREKLERIRDLMDANVRDAKVQGFEGLIDSIELPDPDDRHVVAAAIKCNADAIVTFNLKDFPDDNLSEFGIEVIHPDDFICYQIDLSPVKACKAVKSQRKALKRPPMKKEEFLANLQKQQLPQTVSVLKQFIDFI